LINLHSFVYTSLKFLYRAKHVNPASKKAVLTASDATGFISEKALNKSAPLEMQRHKLCESIPFNGLIVAHG
jgi:hypothetical protein